MDQSLTLLDCIASAILDCTINQRKLTEYHYRGDDQEVERCRGKVSGLRILQMFEVIRRILVSGNKGVLRHPWQS